MDSIFVESIALMYCISGLLMVAFHYKTDKGRNTTAKEMRSHSQEITR
jgi:hypothetical protein